MDLVITVWDDDEIIWVENALQQSLGVPFCDALPNSTGFIGRLSAFGSPVLASHNLQLIGEDLPEGSFGFFLMSQNTGVIPVGQGVLCLDHPIVRLNSGQGAVLVTGSDGSASRHLNLADLPQDTMVLPGQSWAFQLWHRDVDPVTGAPSMNFSQGLQVSFN